MKIRQITIRQIAVLPKIHSVKSPIHSVKCPFLPNFRFVESPFLPKNLGSVRLGFYEVIQQNEFPVKMEIRRTRNLLKQKFNEPEFQQIVNSTNRKFEDLDI